MHVILYSLTTLTAYFLGFHLSHFIEPSTAMIGGLWSVISAFVVADPIKHSAIFLAAKERITGTAFGCFLAAIYLKSVNFSLASFVALIFFSSLFFFLLKKTEHTKLVNITIAVVVIVSTVTNASPFINAGLRFIESVIGVFSAIFCVFIISKLKDMTVTK